MKHSFDITGFQLKIAAIIAMTCNHVANVFGISTLGAPLCFVLYMVGGVTFPIMAFLLVEGYVHTSNLKKYALRLFAFAAVSQIPYYLVFGSRLNVLFTLLIGLGILWLSGRFNSGLGLVAVVVCTAVLHNYLDWGTTGFVIIYMFSTLREAQRLTSRAPQNAEPSAETSPSMDTPVYSDANTGYVLADAPNSYPAGTSPRELIETSNVSRETQMARRRDLVTIIGTMIIPMIVTCLSGIQYGNVYALGYALVGYTIATVLLCGYRGRRGRSMKWFFYAYYPLHLFAIWLVTLIL